MFDVFCAICALVLLSMSNGRFKGMSLTMFLFFFVSLMVYEFAFLEFRSQNRWAIYQFYSLIDCVCIYALKKLQSHFVILILLALNVLYNICTSLYYIYPLIPELVYELYVPICGSISVLCLLYMWMISDYGIKHINKRSSNNSFITRLLLFRVGYVNRLHVGRIS